MSPEYSWIDSLDPTVQLAAFRRLTAYLSSRELMQVVKRVEAGESVYEAHRDAGLIARYYVHLLRIIDQLENAE
jgi:hypothetical protein